MQIVLRLEENLAVNHLTITRNTERLPYTIVNYYYHRTPDAVNSLKQQIQIAEKRLEWFEPLLEQPWLNKIRQMENILVHSCSLFTGAEYQHLQRHWLFALDRIGDLLQPQELVFRLAKRLNEVLKQWSCVSGAYQKIDDIVRAGFKEQFQRDCRILWKSIPDLENFDAEQAIQDALEGLIQLQAQLKVKV